MDKILTISIAAYNIEKFIRHTLDSCIVPLEYRKYLEVIIVNDGSKDNTSRIAHEYEEKYPDLFHCIDKENGGYGSTINTAVKIAKGRYFRLLDGDDWYNTQELVCFLEKVKNVSADLILCDFSVIYASGRREKHCLDIVENKCKDISTLNIDSDLSMYRFAYRTELLRHNQIKISENCFYTDVEFMIIPLKFVKTFCYVSNDVYQYCIGIEGQSVSMEGMKRHYKDAEIVANVLMNNLKEGFIHENIFRISLNHASMMVRMMAKCFMCAEVSMAQRKKILTKMNEIKKNNVNVYRKVRENSLFKVMLITHFYVYPAWVLYKKVVRG